jgi:hypothetical protein
MRRFDFDLSELTEAAVGALESVRGPGSCPPNKQRRLTLPGHFCGWSYPTPLSQVLTAAAGTLFNRPGIPLLYRISLLAAAASRLRYRIPVLYIGMVWGTGESVRDRIRSHVRGTRYESEVAKLKGSLGWLFRRGIRPTEIVVELGRVEGIRQDPKVIRAYEAALQITEPYRSYRGGVTTFE